MIAVIGINPDMGTKPQIKKPRPKLMPWPPWKPKPKPQLLRDLEVKAEATASHRECVA